MQSVTAKRVMSGNDSEDYIRYLSMHCRRHVASNVPANTHRYGNYMPQTCLGLLTTGRTGLQPQAHGSHRPSMMSKKNY